MDLTALEERTRAFYDWELRGRGWTEHATHVALEPPFVPFRGYDRAVDRSSVDDGRRPTLLSKFWDSFLGSAGSTLPRERRRDDPGPFEASVPPFEELELLVPAAGIGVEQSAAWLRSISAVEDRLAFELTGAGGSVSLRLAGTTSRLRVAGGQFRGFFGSATARTPDRSVLDSFTDAAEATVAIEFGLGREFMLPLRALPSDPHPLTPIVSALSEAGRGEFALFQVLFEPTQNAWALHALSAILGPDGEPFFLDAPELTTLAEEKLSSPLYAVVIRALAKATNADRATELLGGIAAGLNQYGDPNRNMFVPLSGNREDLIGDMLIRANRKTGMLLSLDELVSIVRIPSDKLRSPALLREQEPLERLPQEVLGEGVIFGEGRHLKESSLVRIAVDARVQHTHVVGASGTGKSTLLVSLAIQDVEAGRGVGVIDPHGDLIDEIAARIPASRSDDVILFDPSDPDWVVGWNVLGAHSDIEKELLASDLTAAFRRLSTSWGDQMTTVLANAVLAFLESSRGGTLTELRRFLLDESYRTSFLSTVRDDHVRSFWNDEFPLLIGKKPQAPILTRLDTFLRSRRVRAVVTENEKPLNFRSIIDDKKIFLARLSQGAIGEENAGLLGSMLVSKFHQVSLSRQNIAEGERQPFFLYIDEFHHMATPSMASLFSGVRKYRLGLTIAHQDLFQLHSVAPEVGRSALTNAYTRVMFRVSDEDAQKLQKGIDTFTAEDLTSLGRGQAICRVGRRDSAFRLRTIPLDRVHSNQADERRRALRHQSGAQYGRPRREGQFQPPPPPETQQVPPPPIVRPQAEPSVLPQPGRGGPIHKYLQGLIREAGHTHGFRSDIEFELPSGQRIDVFLRRDELSIACEIAGTTTVEREVANLEKCLSVECSHVCAVSLDSAFLQELEAAISSWPQATRQKVQLFSPQELLAFLSAQPGPPAAKVAGYSVQVRRSGTAGNDSGRRKAVADVMMRSIRRMREEK